MPMPIGRTFDLLGNEENLMKENKFPLGLWVAAGILALLLLPVGTLGAAMTKGYNDDFCFSSRVTQPPGSAGGSYESHLWSRTVECHYDLQDGSRVTETHQVGTYTSMFFLAIAYGAPLAYVVMLLVALFKAGPRSPRPSPS
jgi:hypothetical protein